MKTIIKRKLNLNVKYVCIDKKYIPLFDGGGTCCDNCGKLIANIATVKSSEGVYYIGFDCLETFLLNNSLLDGFDLEQYEATKKQIAVIIRLSKQVKEVISNNPQINITGLLFNKPSYKSDFYPFYYLKNNELTSRDNSYLKGKNLNFDFLIEIFKNIFPQLTIITN